MNHGELGDYLVVLKVKGDELGSVELG